MPVYHFSEDPSIERFNPRPSRLQEFGPAVWAVDDWHAPMFYTPRDCPRVCYYPVSTTTEEDVRRLFGVVTARMVIAVELAWLERIMVTPLYRYVLPAEGFVSCGDPSYFLVSRHSVTPLRIEPVGDLISAIVAADVELRVLERIDHLGQEIARSTMQYSLCRMKNAGPARRTQETHETKV